jgi:hypothetical protein
MQKNDINSIGFLHNNDGSIALTISLKNEVQPVFVSVSSDEFQASGGTEGLNKNKQLAIDFYAKYGAGRSKRV